jgi:hypothetical protein
MSMDVLSTIDADRRRLIGFSVLAVALGRSASAAAEAKSAGTGSQHDFDFFLGSWKVRHRRLRMRLASNDEWDEFDGTTKCQSFLGGIANINDSSARGPRGSYRGIGIRAYDAKTNTWADWYLSERTPTLIDVPGLGRFVNGVGTFLSDDTFEGKPIKVRGLWSDITPNSLQWAQAFSPDGGRTWETNWIMRYTRIT